MGSGRALRAEWLQKHVAANSDGQVRRIAGKFALVAVAGELATTFGTLPWETGAACWPKGMFRLSDQARGGIGALEIERGIDQVRAFIAANGSSRFENPRDYEAREYQHPQTGDTMKREAHPPRTVMRAGWREPDGDDWDYFITAPAWRDEVCAGFNAKTIAEALRDRGLLRCDDDNRLTRQKRFPGHSSVKVYHVLGRILADDAWFQWIAPPAPRCWRRCLAQPGAILLPALPSQFCRW